MTVDTSTSMAIQAVAMQQQGTQQQIAIAMIRQQAQGEQALVALLEQSAGPPPAPGTGQVVDLRA
jgi:hypothetical protein